MKAKTILSSLLVCMMLLGVMSITAMAETATMPEVKNGIIKLTEDVVLSEKYEIGEDATVTLDLNGHSITGVTGSETIVNNGNLTIMDSGTDGSITLKYVYNSTNAKMIINGGTFNTTQSYDLLNYQGEVIINGGTFNGSALNYAIYSYDNGHKLTINNAVVNGYAGCLNAYGSNGSVIIKDAEFNFAGVDGKTYHIVYIANGTTLTIDGGSFLKVGNVDLSAEGSCGVCVNGTNASAIINGGTFDGATSDVELYDSASSIKVNGGTYQDNTAKKYLEEGAFVTCGGKTYTKTDGALEEVNGVAKIGSTIYGTLIEAIDDAVDGDTVTLLSNVTEDEVILIGKSIILEGRNNTITSSASRVIRVTTANTNVTINNLNVVSTALRVGESDIRGISIDIQNGITLTLNNCTVDFTDASANDWSYAVNQSGEYTSGNTIVVNGGSYEGANVINIWGNNHNVTVKNATLTSIYAANEQYVGVCVKVNNKGDAVIAVENTTFNGEHAKAIEETADSTVTTENNTDNTKRYVAKTGSVYYHSLADAIDAASENATVKLIKDIIVDSAVSISKPINLDLGGKTLSNGGSNTNVIEISENVTVTNGTVSGYRTTTSNGVIKVLSGKLTLDGVTLVNTGTSYNNRALRVQTGAAAELINCNVTGFISGVGSTEIKSGTYKNCENSTYNVLDGAGIAVSGGTFYYEVETGDCAENFKPKDNGDGTWTVKTSTFATDYTINDIDDLILFRDMVEAGDNFSGKTVVLAASIDLGSISNWEPIGKNENAPFCGTFDGGNKIISNLKVGNGNNMGLFGALRNATIKNLTVNNAEVITQGTGVGVIAGRSFGNSYFENLKVTGTVKVEGMNYVGGMVGYAYGHYTNCAVDVETGSYVQGNVPGNTCYAGGLAGWNGDGASNFTDCSVNNITVRTLGGDNGYSYGAGGLTGLVMQGNVIKGCSVTNVTIEACEGTMTGMIAGANNGTIASPSWVMGNTTENVVVRVAGEQVNAGITGTHDSGDGEVTEMTVISEDATFDTAGKLTGGNYTVYISNVATAEKAAIFNMAPGYDVFDNGDGTYTIVEIKWSTDTDAGYYLVGETKTGLMRFLFALDIDESKIAKSGIKYLKSSSITDFVASQEDTSGKKAAFYGDITGIEEAEYTDTYYAVAYVETTDGKWYWSESVGCTPNFENHFENYTVEVAE